MYKFDNLHHFNQTMMRIMKDLSCRKELKSWVLDHTVTPTNPIEISMINSSTLLGSDYLLGGLSSYAVRKTYMPGENNTVSLQLISLDPVALERYQKDEFKLCFDGLEAQIYFGRGHYNQMVVAHPQKFDSARPFLTITAYPEIALSPSTSKVSFSLPTCPHNRTASYLSIEMDNSIAENAIVPCGKTCRDLIRNIANNMLAYVGINGSNSGLWLRESY